MTSVSTAFTNIDTPTSVQNYNSDVFLSYDTTSFASRDFSRQDIRSAHQRYLDEEYQNYYIKKTVKDYWQTHFEYAKKDFSTEYKVFFNRELKENGAVYSMPLVKPEEVLKGTVLDGLRLVLKHYGSDKSVPKTAFGMILSKNDDKPDDFDRNWISWLKF